MHKVSCETAASMSVVSQETFAFWAPRLHSRQWATGGRAQVLIASPLTTFHCLTVFPTKYNTTGSRL